MYKYFKAISTLILLLLLLSGCGKKLPPQISEGKAFSKQPYVVQGNIRYSVIEYRIGTSRGDKPPAGNQLYTSIKIEAENIGATEEKLQSDDFKFTSDEKTHPLSNADPKSILLKPLKSGDNKKSWLIFQVPEEPKGQKELLIKNAKVIIE